MELIFSKWEVALSLACALIGSIIIPKLVAKAAAEEIFQGKFQVNIKRK